MARLGCSTMSPSSTPFSSKQDLRSSRSCSPIAPNISTLRRILTVTFFSSSLLFLGGHAANVEMQQWQMTDTAPPGGAQHQVEKEDEDEAAEPLLPRGRTAAGYEVLDLHDRASSSSHVPFTGQPRDSSFSHGNDSGMIAAMDEEAQPLLQRRPDGPRGQHRRASSSSSRVLTTGHRGSSHTETGVELATTRNPELFDRLARESILPVMKEKM
ncbi:unnamed protein product [Amoebophrya sp. A120]|nr:unnamed protein product [Amoebophrya sp. A120]|eukprot:GSA120T00014714001.1